MDRDRFESWRRRLARITLIWVCLFGAYTLAELFFAFHNNPAAGGAAPTAPLNTRRLLDQVMAFTMMPIAAFAIYHFAVLLMARRLPKDDP